MTNVADIVDKLQEALIAYENSNPIMSDAEYDALVEELRDIDPDNAFLVKIGTTNQLGKVAHLMPMGSQTKIITREALRRWLGGHQNFIISPKYDGCSIELVYENGKFLRAVSRGNGNYGDDVTHTIMKAKGFPRTISDKGTVAVRCEAILPILTWQTHLSSVSANPRNAGAGIVRRLDGENAQLLQCICLFVKRDNDGLTLAEDLEWLKSEGFTISSYVVMSPHDDIEYYVDSWTEIVRDAFPYEIDGLVIAYDSKMDHIEKDPLLPAWSRAWKFPPRSGFAEIEGVEWSVGIQGSIHPTAMISPVNVAGVTITRVTLHNPNIIKDLGCMIGDTVEVIRAGDVIPKIVRVVKKGKLRNSIEIDECPGCKSKLRHEGGAFHYCSNPHKCPGVQIQILENYIQKREIMHCGPKAIYLMHWVGYLNNIRDFYNLNLNNIIASGVGAVMAEKIFAEITKSRKVSDFSEVIGCIGIDMLGRREAAKLLGLLENRPKTGKDWCALTVADIEFLPGFGLEKARRITDSLRYMKELILTLDECIEVVAAEAPVAVGTKLTGMNICCTGKSTRTRKELEAIIVGNGGKMVDGVSKTTNYLVIADVNSTSGKAKDAIKHGTKLITEEDLIKMVS